MNMNMDKGVKARWVAALRSGEYKQQSVGHLCFAIDGISREFCCLGVLCELAVAEGIIPPPERNGMINIYADHYSSYPPRAVMNWAGLNEAEQLELARMNDVARISFLNIADYIEQNL